MKLELINHNPKNKLKSKNQSLLFLHGMYHGAWCFEEYFLPHFANLGYDCYAMSLRNHGKSESKKPMWKLRISDYVTDLKNTIDKIGTNPILIGHSMGGFIIQKYLEKYEAPATILLASVPPKGVTSGALRVVKNYPFAFLKANLTWNLYHIIKNKKACKYLFLDPKISNDKLNEYHSKLDNESFLAYLDMMGFNLPKVKKITSEKMLIIGAENDKAVSIKDVKHTAKTYGKNFVIIPNTSHDVMLDSNWKLVAKEISNWLDTEIFYLC